MKYFLHDTSAFQDEKITELYIKFGYEGVGLFFTILEKIAFQEKPVKTDILKHQLKVGKKLEKCWKFMEEINLISSNNGDTFNEQLLNFSESYQIKKEKTRKKVADWRNKHKDKENVTGYVPVSNPPKVKLSKVKVNKDTTFNFKNSLIDLGFEHLLVEDWLTVRKIKRCGNTKTALDRFMKEVGLANADRNEILRICIEKSWGGFEAEWLKNITNLPAKMKELNLGNSLPYENIE